MSPVVVTGSHYDRAQRCSDCSPGIAALNPGYKLLQTKKKKGCGTP
jgi:hypothetical protein